MKVYTGESGARPYSALQEYWLREEFGTRMGVSADCVYVDSVRLIENGDCYDWHSVSAYTPSLPNERFTLTVGVLNRRRDAIHVVPTSARRYTENQQTEESEQI